MPYARHSSPTRSKPSVPVFKTPTLELEEVHRALTQNGYVLTGKKGSQERWERASEEDHRIVLIETADAPYAYGSGALAGIIRATGLGERLFYHCAGKAVAVLPVSNLGRYPRHSGNGLALHEGARGNRPVAR
jgi:hypothetical protein